VVAARRGKIDAPCVQHNACVSSDVPPDELNALVLICIRNRNVADMVKVGFAVLLAFGTTFHRFMPIQLLDPKKPNRSRFFRNTDPTNRMAMAAARPIRLRGGGAVSTRGTIAGRR